MASQFYKRYVPPPKVPPLEDRTVKNPTTKPEGSSSLLRRHSKAASNPVIHRNLESIVTKNPAKRSLLEPDIDGRPAKRSSPVPKASKEPAENTGSEPDSSDTVKKHGLTPLPQPAQAEEGPKVSVSSALPEWIRAPTIAYTSIEMPFDETFSLGKIIVNNLSKNGFSKANGLQSAILPMLVPTHHGPERYFGDICISAATGSGKTLAYALPLVETLRNKPVTRLRGLVVVPTRELVTQARETLGMSAAGTGMKIGTAVGNKPLKEEQDLLVQKGQRWDPAAYRTEQEKEVDEDEELMDWDSDAIVDMQDDFECWHDHVVEYTSKIDILVCTPGRLVDHINSTKGFHLHHVQWLVVDEADRLLDESFQQWVEIMMPQLEYLPPLEALEQQIHTTFHIPRRREVRKIVLSATMTRDVGKIISLKLRWPRLVVLEGSKEASELHNSHTQRSHPEENIELPAMLQETAMAVANVEDKPLYLLQLLHSFAKSEVDNERDKTVSPSKDPEMRHIRDTADEDESNDATSSSSQSSGAARKNSKATRSAIPGTLVFANSNESALRLARLLAILLPEQQIRALTKSPGDKQGRKTLNMFRKGELSVIVATDLASRGLDIPNLSHVINYDLPTSLNSYVHRVGRTARAGKEGRATTLVERRQAKWFWNDIARTNRIVRARKVARLDGGLHAGDEEYHRYEDALRVLEQEAKGRNDKTS